MDLRIGDGLNRPLMLHRSDMALRCLVRISFISASTALRSITLNPSPHANRDVSAMSGHWTSE